MECWCLLTSVFIQFPFCRYRHFIVLLVSSQSAEDHLEWCGLVESKVRLLITNLERNQHISLAHVNPKCFERTKSAAGSNVGSGNDVTDKLVSAPHCSMWFIGLEFERTENLNVDLTESIQQFTNSVHKHAVSIRISSFLPWATERTVISKFFISIFHFQIRWI